MEYRRRETRISNVALQGTRSTLALFGMLVGKPPPPLVPEPEASCVLVDVELEVTEFGLLLELAELDVVIDGLLDVMAIVEDTLDVEVVDPDVLSGMH